MGGASGSFGDSSRAALQDAQPLPLFEAPGITATHAGPALVQIQVACFLNTLGIGAALHACWDLLPGQGLAAAGAAMLLANFAHQRLQADKVNRLLARHARRLDLVGPHRLRIECEELLEDAGALLLLRPGEAVAARRLVRLWELESDSAGREAEGLRSGTGGGATMGALVAKRLLHLDSVAGQMPGRDCLGSLWPRRVVAEERLGTGTASVRLALPAALVALPTQEPPKSLVEAVGSRSMALSFAWNAAALSGLATSAALAHDWRPPADVLPQTWLPKRPRWLGGTDEP